MTAVTAVLTVKMQVFAVMMVSSPIYTVHVWKCPIKLHMPSIISCLFGWWGEACGRRASKSRTSWNLHWGAVGNSVWRFLGRDWRFCGLQRNGLFTKWLVCFSTLDKCVYLHWYSKKGLSISSSAVGASALLSAYFSRGSGPILMDDVRCTGSEDRLIDCRYDSNTDDCFHYEDASVRCLPKSKEAKLDVFTVCILFL